MELSFFSLFLTPTSFREKKQRPISFKSDV